MWRSEVPNSLTGEDRQKLTLLGSRCPICHNTYFPARRNCPDCLSRDSIDRIALSKQGRLHSFSISQVAPPGYESPHVQGYIELEPGGPCIFSLLVDCGSPPELKIGQKMHLILVENGRDESGRVVIGYRFKPDD
jgi:uncharacterized OB-fold protein